MTVNRTTLLDLPLPVTGTESGTWGDTTNNGLSQYMDIAIAGMNSLTSANFTAGALTLANTLGDSSATNIAAGSAQYATIRVSSLAVNSTITAPGSNRSYRIINADATYSLTIKASGQTGVTFLPGQTGVVAFNGTDYVIVGVVGAGTATDNAVARFDGTTGEIIQNSVVTIADSTGDISGVGQLNATTLDATNIEVTNIKAKDGTAAASIADSTGVVSITANPVLSGGTANGVGYLNGSKVLTTGSALTFDGALLTQTVSDAVTSNKWAAATGKLRLRPYVDSTIGALYESINAAESAYLPLSFYASNIRFQADSNIISSVGGSEQMRLTSTGLGIGTSSPSYKLQVQMPSSGIGAAFRYVGGTNNPGLFFSVNESTTVSTIDASGSTSGILAFATSGTEKMRLDSSGNLGIGVTPSAWAWGAGAGTALDIGSVGTVFSSTSISGAGTEIGRNAYYNGTNFVYKINGAATRYAQAGGVHYWYTAASGTAGNTITFTQALTLDASGNLLLGGTSAGASSAASLAIFNGTAPTGSVTNGIILYAEDVSSSSELKVRDEAGNVTTLSPHNFSLIPEGPSEDMAWAYYSEKGGKRINVDMLKLARMVEKLTGEKLVYES